MSRRAKYLATVLLIYIVATIVAYDFYGKNGIIVAWIFYMVTLALPLCFRPLAKKLDM